MLNKQRLHITILEILHIHMATTLMFSQLLKYITRLSTLEVYGHLIIT